VFWWRYFILILLLGLQSLTTFIGKTSETQLLKNQFGNFKHSLVGEMEGGVNLLNLPEPYFIGDKWWDSWNHAWMKRALQRRDDIYVASAVKNIDMSAYNILNQKRGLTFFARELNECYKAGYRPRNLSKAEWDYITSLLDQLF
jgi:hypothetical protein